MTHPQFCTDASPTFFNLLDFSIAPAFLYYAYMPMILLLLSFSVYILFSDRFHLRSRLLAGLSLSLAVWVIITLLQWIAAPVTLVLFTWDLWNLANIATFTLTGYFVYVMLTGNDVPPIVKTISLALILPIILFTPTTLNISAFDIYLCQGVMEELLTYTYLLDITVIVLIGIQTVRTVLTERKNNKTGRRALIIGLSAIIFLSTFLFTTIWGDLIGDYRVEMLGPIGAFIFLLAMIYLTIAYRTFNVKVVLSEMLIIGLLAVMGSLLFFRNIDNVRIATAGSLILAIIIGWSLAKSVRREVQQREEIQKLARDLAKANKRLRKLDQAKSEFVSVASHQLRSPLTSIRGYASMLLEGSYGKLSKKATAAITRIHDSSRFMALTVEDFLNVSRIEAGAMKYEMSEFDICRVAQTVYEDVKPILEAKQLAFTLTKNIEGSCTVRADIGKTRQVIQNLIDNATKYTPKGSVSVTISSTKNDSCVEIAISDTGIGMSEETIENLFGKFSRAENANSVNVVGSGLGLYVAQVMTKQMGGTVIAASPGEGKGSTFIITFPRIH